MNQFKVCFICQGARAEHKSDADSLGLMKEEEKKQEPHEEELEDIKMLKKISADTMIITLPPLEYQSRQGSANPEDIVLER